MAISGTGSAGMEAAISNFVEPGSKFIVFANGFFCDRMCEMGRRQGATVIRYEAPWGQSFDEAAAAEFIRSEKPQAVAFVHGETSTGVYTSGEAICAAAHEVGAVTIADCVTSLGTMPINLDATGIDVAYSCTQKGLSCPPGLSPISCSPFAMEKLKARTTVNHSWYLDLKLLAEYYEGAHRYHHTAPITMFYALREGLNLVLEEGVEARFARHKANHEKLVAGLEAMGMEMLVNHHLLSEALNAKRVQEALEGKAVTEPVKTLLPSRLGWKRAPSSLVQLATAKLQAEARPAAATVQNVTRPFQKAATSAMNSAVKAKSAPKRRGSSPAGRSRAKGCGSPRGLSGSRRGSARRRARG